MSSLTEGISWEFPSLNSSLFSPFECNTEPKSNFEKLWTDARVLEDEIEVLKWMARRKEMEWDCAKEMVDKKKNTIKQVKKKINMVKTLNDLGPQLNVESDDEDTPFEDDDDDDEDSNSEEDVENSATSSTFGTDVPSFFVRQPSPTHKSCSDFTSEKDKKVKMSTADFVSTETHFSRGHLCLNCKEKSPLFVCSLCKNHWYCSTSCQIQDWPDHQTKCGKEPVKQNKKHVLKNRQLIKFPLRSELLRHKSKETRQTSATTKSTNCLMCRQNLPYFLCSECRNFWYCSHKCHHDHWDEHKKFCLGGDEK